MKITVDRQRCASIGLCESVAPDLFQVDDDGVLRLVREDVSADELAQVRIAVDDCPTCALSLQES
ncbi:MULTISPECIES: ferredoxin [unclassified Mycobacterium]|uniref:ferredoxin n=1 Tax=unclassified Mycobacterium TaxID=2642494 RepID=UPI00048FB52C|nr:MULTISPECIES: ferredoxin [unclassified Mycobacterium]SEA60231.1 ferredoxin [Mycobacterium sp. 283mftsu]